jgi:hypothetical protein
VILIEAANLGGARLSLVLVPGCSREGSGLWYRSGWIVRANTSHVSIGAASAFARPTSSTPLTIPLAIAVAVITFAIFRLAATQRVAG